MKHVIAFVVLVALSIPVSLLGGVVLADYWRWFVEPVFAVPSLTYMQAVGLSLVAGFFKIGLKTGFGKESDGVDGMAEAFGNLAAILVMYLMTWGIGAVWHLFM